MTTTKIEDPKDGDQVVLYLDEGWIQLTRGHKEVMIEVFNTDDNRIYSLSVWENDLRRS